MNKQRTVQLLQLGMMLANPSLGADVEAQWITETDIAEVVDAVKQIHADTNNGAMRERLRSWLNRFAGVLALNDDEKVQAAIFRTVRQNGFRKTVEAKLRTIQTGSGKSELSLDFLKSVHKDVSALCSLLSSELQKSDIDPKS
ncbi:hypothetical protein KOR42_05850 [Thalassoglobus neptunius]|uniref:Uncharacterized protein n=1 Tax=Thalassoglobus neptunius TaxID=1938619 RepID=A0A5C5X2H2_9PLAN|nr:hypothetical protein [Thalassoglobus neptunius]TWT57227.1 hypothetical protein KOR42_05850 [Thalassoglobus neptunius]